LNPSAASTNANTFTRLTHPTSVLNSIHTHVVILLQSTVRNCRKDPDRVQEVGAAERLLDLCISLSLSLCDQLKNRRVRALRTVFQDTTTKGWTIDSPLLISHEISAEHRLKLMVTFCSHFPRNISRAAPETYGDVLQRLWQFLSQATSSIFWLLKSTFMSYTT
jgi:hypothetical protein